VPTKIIILLISSLSLRGHHLLGKSIGSILFYFNNRSRHIAEVNIEICFPDLTKQEKKQLLKTSLRENGKTLIECFWLWRHPEQVLNHLLGDINNKDLLKGTNKQSLGTIFITPHFGSWEFIGLLTAANNDLLILYAPPKSKYINQLSCTGRISTGGKIISTEQLNIKRLMQHIKSGGSIGILPDQVPDGNGGIFSSFFGRKSYTSTLVCKLANKLKCQVVFCYALRKEKPYLHYDAYYIQAENLISHDNIEIATNALNKTIERFISQAPEQYIWGYKRFKRPAPGDNYPY